MFRIFSISLIFFCYSKLGFSQCTSCGTTNPTGANPTTSGVTCINTDKSYSNIIMAFGSSLEICDANVTVAVGISGFVNISIYGTGSLTVGSGISAGTINTSDCTNDGTVKVAGSNLDLSGYGCTPLPVELINFSSSVNGNSSQLEWTTASELNNDHFLIYRSSDLEKWDLIGLLQGSGTTTNEVNYEFLDRNLDNGFYYYQLIQTDYDGTQSKSKIISAQIEKPTFHFSIYPNPTNTNCMVTSDSNISSITLKDSFGQVLISLENIKNTFVQVQTSNIEQGVYYIEVQTENGNQTKKLVKN